MAENPTKYVLEWGIGLGALSLFGLIMLILFGNLGSSQVGFNNATISNTNVTNQTGAYINLSNYTLSGFNSSWSDIIITRAVNASNGSTITASLYSVNTSGVVRNTTTAFWDSVWLTFNYDNSYVTQIQKDVDNYQSNYTGSVLNTGKQFPTVGTILGVALLLVILIGILVYAIKRMGGVANMGGKSSGGSGGLPGGDFG